MNEKIILCCGLPSRLADSKKIKENKEFFLKQIHINELKKIEWKNKIKAGDRNFQSEVNKIGSCISTFFQTKYF